MRASGLVGTLLYAAAIVWMYSAQPQTVAEVTGGLTSTIGVYRIDQQAFDDGLGFFKRDQFDEARSAFARADPAGRDASRSSTSPTPTTARAGVASTTTMRCSSRDWRRRTGPSRSRLNTGLSSTMPISACAQPTSCAPSSSAA